MAIAAVGQICSTASMTHNLEQCVRLVSKAAAAGAKVLFLPEASDYIATSPAESLALARPVATSPFVTGLQAAAAEHALAVHVGIHVPVPVQAASPTAAHHHPLLPTVPRTGGQSRPEGDDGNESDAASAAAAAAAAATTKTATTTTTTTTTTTKTKLYNRTIWIDERGAVAAPASYDKLHLFDYGALRESATTQAGAGVTPPFASAVGRLGSLVCFDLRFPEAARRLAQPPPVAPWAAAPAQVLLYPSAFTVPTGRAHWEVLLRARAIETQSWVVAAAQVGRHSARRVSYGRSLVVDPWGRVALALGGVEGEHEDDWEAEAGAVGQLGLVDIDLDEWARVREKMPLVRRTDIYSDV